MCFKRPRLIKLQSVDNNSLFTRLVGAVETKKDQFEVPFTQTALVIKNGGNLKHYESGTYPVFENRAELDNWKRGCSIEIIYMPKTPNVEIRWGVGGINYRDTISNKVVNAGANGMFRIKIVNHQLFFEKAIGMLREFSLVDFENKFRPDVVNVFTEIFVNYARDNDLSYDDYDSQKMRVSYDIADLIKHSFVSSWGIEISEFIINKIDVQAEDKESIEKVFDEIEQESKRKRKKEELKEDLAELERLDDKKWEREQWLREREKEEKLAMMEVMKVTGKVDNKKKGANFCPNCGHSHEPDVEFCPNCGKKLSETSTVTCPECKTQNKGNAKFCSKCGAKLS